MKKGERFATELKSKLLELFSSPGILHISTSHHYTWSSGVRSPIYLDLRSICGEPAWREPLLNAMQIYLPPEVEAVGGVATGGIPLSAMLAERLALPYFYVRPEAKGHGLKKSVEGTSTTGKKVLLFEEVVSTGMSLLYAVENLQSTAPQSIHLLALFSYGFPSAHEKIKRSGVRTFTVLVTFNEILEHLKDQKLLPQETIAQLAEWHHTVSQQVAEQV